MPWLPFESGKTIGTKGPHEGSIVIDEEHTAGARLTLERKGEIAPFAITVAIYGSLLHSVFAALESETMQLCETLKEVLERILSETNDKQREELLHRLLAEF